MAECEKIVEQNSNPEWFFEIKPIDILGVVSETIDNNPEDLADLIDMSKSRRHSGQIIDLARHVALLRAIDANRQSIPNELFENLLRAEERL